MRRLASTATADDVLRYVAGYQERRGGISPSYQNICDDLGIGSKSHVDRLLTNLELDSQIARLRERKRAINILHPVAIPRLPTGEPLYFVRIPQ